MSYPAMTEYHAAVQDPRRSFADPVLQAGHVKLNQLSLPVAASGGFVLTYTMTSGGRKYAVRCFHREVPGAQARYAAVSSTLAALNSTYFVPFNFEPNGIKVRGQFYPIVKMDWIEGQTLGEYLDQNSRNPSALASLRVQVRELASFLETNGIAHGDLQNENILIANGRIKLIDYDGMFVPGMRMGDGNEVGQRHFQHPLRDVDSFGPAMDRFSFILLDLSLAVLEAAPALHTRFREGGLAIIFKGNDFVDPSTSEAFSEVKKIPALQDCIQKFEAVCRAPLSVTPSLSDFIAGINIPTVVASRPAESAQARPTTPQRYIGAFDVVDAADFEAVRRREGDKVELIGKIVSVKVATGRRGRSRGLPYVFVNFGVWNHNSVKLSIWAEGLRVLSEKPTEAWVGRWISVTGLIEPPYEGSHYGKPYLNVGITVTANNQIVRLDERTAKFRLGRGAPPRSTRSNEDVLRGLQDAGGPRTPSPTIPSPRRPVRTGPPPPPASTGTRNEQILRAIRAQTPSGSAQHTTPPTTPAHQPSNVDFIGRIPWWVWAGGILLVISMLNQCGANG